jgi:quercetin dioxygenase-like cupin family protein
VTARTASGATKESEGSSPDQHPHSDKQGQLSSDFTQLVLLHSGDMMWSASPSPSVYRKRLELAGPIECGRVTSIVRYEPASEFHRHGHPDGEEILVLKGTFSDEKGDYPGE